jgi:alcohol oxidase
MPLDKGRAPEPNFLNSNQQELFPELEYSKEDIEHVINWTKRTSPSSLFFCE